MKKLRPTATRCVKALVLISVVSVGLQVYSLYMQPMDSVPGPRLQTLRASSNHSASESGSAHVALTFATEGPMGLLRRVLEIRRENTIKNCNAHAPWRRVRFNPAMMLDSKHGVFYCPVAGVGTASFRTYLLEMVGQHNLSLDIQKATMKSRRTQLTYIATQDYMKIKELTKNRFGFVFARNPWSRLWSTYARQYKGVPKSSYFNTVKWRAVLAQYLANSTKLALPYRSDVTFPEFLVWVMASLMQGDPRMVEEFAPMHQICNPCVLNYSFIGHLENATQEFTVLQHDIFKTDNPKLPEINRKGPPATVEDIAGAYKDVPPRLIDNLRNYYERDFELFGYSNAIPGTK